MRVTVIGTGYVGTVTGACLAYLGHRVTCVDTDAAKIETLRLGRTPIYEPGLEELIALAKHNGGINFETTLEDAVRESDVIFIAVGTPPLPSGEANLAYLEAAARGIGAAMDASKFRVVVLPLGRPSGKATRIALSCEILSTCSSLPLSSVTLVGRRALCSSNVAALRSSSAVNRTLALAESLWARGLSSASIS